MEKITTHHYSTREEWLAARVGTIGASEVGAIVGVSHFATPYQVWERHVTGATLPESVAMKMGHLLEPIVAQLHAEQSGDLMVEGTDDDFIVKNADYPFAAVSPDRYFVTPEGEVYPLECKTTALRVTEDSLPHSWYCQLQYQLAICDMPFGTIAWLCNGRDFGSATFERNQEFIDWLMTKVADFADKINSLTPPEITAADVDVAFGRALALESLEAAEDDLALVAECKKIKSEIEKHQKKLDDLVANLKLRMGTAEVLCADGKKIVTWKNRKGATTFDTKKLKADLPEIYQKYASVGSPTRTFKII